MPAFLRERSVRLPARLSRAGAARWLSWAATVALCFYASWRAAVALNPAAPTASVWPPAGIVLAALLAANPAVSALWLGAFAGGLLAFGSFLPAMSAATASVAGPLAARRLLGAWGWKRLHSAQGASLFAAACAAGGAVSGAMMWLVAGDGWRTALVATAAQSVSLLVVAPALVLWAYHRRLNLGPGRDLEALALLAGGFAVHCLVFLVGPLARSQLAGTFLALPPLLWASVRFGLREAATLNLLLSVAALSSLPLGTGPFGGDAGWQVHLLLQSVLFVAATTTLILAAAVWETKDQVRATVALADSLRDAQRRTAMAVKAARLGIWEYDLGSGLVEWNPECFELFGLPPSAPAPYDFGLSLVADEDRPKVAGAVKAALDPAGSGLYEAEFRLRRADGAPRWMQAKGQTVFETRGGRRTAVRLAGTLIDITADRLAEERLEEQVRRRTEELTRANAELEEFSYSVSHELRAPLRKIGVLAQLLRRDDAGGLSERGRERVERIRAAATRGGRILQDLLQLMRVSRLPLRREEVDLSELARGIPHSGVEVVVEPGLRARADRALAREVLAQLLDNACKFARRSDRPRVEVGRAVRPEGELFFVRDNGPGFDMGFSHKIFGSFERLHSSPDDDGTGVGLAIVQRAVVRHGGRVFAEGALGKGATFYFSLGGEAA